MAHSLYAVRNRVGMRSLVHTFFCVGLITSAIAADFSTPQLAFQEHQSAWKHRNIDQFVSTISFTQEAIEILHAKAPTDAAPDELAVRTLAAARETELRHRLETDGFRPDDLSTCKIVNTWIVSDTETRLPLACTLDGAYLFRAIRLVRLPQGWRVVRTQPSSSRDHLRPVPPTNSADASSPT